MQVLRRRLPTLLWALAALLLVVFGVRSLLGDVYPVASSSMEPALMPGERVFMRYGNDDLERFDLVVVLDPAGRTIVKRLIGMPNEAVTLSPSGDVWIDSKPLPLDVVRPPAIPVFDSALHDYEESFQHGGSQLDPWELEDGVYRLKGLEVPRGAYAGLLRYRKLIQDDRLSASGELVVGTTPVGDLILECDVRVNGNGGMLRFELDEGAEIYSLLIDLQTLPNAQAQFMSTSTRGTVLAMGSVEMEEGVWVRVRFANVDDSLCAWVGDACVSWSGAPSPLTRSASRGERVRFGGAGCNADFRNIRILRDRHYTMRGTYAIGRQLQLGPDEIFLLGDNSNASQDSRELGPIPLKRVLGEPTWVVWPLSRVRRLGANGSR